MYTKENVLGFLAGIGCGAGIALLVAPKAGGETRALIAQKTRQGTDKIKHQATAVRDSATGMLEKGQQEILHQRDRVKSAMEAGAQAYHSSVA